MPMAVWRAGIDKIEAAARAVDMPLRLDDASACPHAHGGSRSSRKRPNPVLDDKSRRD